MAMAPEDENPPVVSPKIFSAVQLLEVDLCDCTDAELRPVLASLVRMSLIASLDKSTRCIADRTKVLEVLSRIELVNNLVALLSIDFHALEMDVRKEQQLRTKGSASASDSILISNLALGPAIEFERSDATRRLRLVLSELLFIMGQIQSQNTRMEENPSNGGSSSPLTVKHSELFDHLVYFSEVCDVLCIAMAELPMLLSPPEVCEALLRLKYGPWIICHVVVNQPDSFNDVVYHLLRNGDKQDDDNSNSIRQRAISLLCQMNPIEMANVRSKCIEWCRMPSLALRLTIDMQEHNQSDPDDLVSFMSGLLLGTDPQIRSWISFFVRSGQKRRNEHLFAYRKCLLLKLSEYLNSVNESGGVLRQENVVKASALLRLYTALRGIAGMKFSDEEIQLLFGVITCQPPATPAGVKFVSIGLSMLIACNSIITSSQSLERKTVDWIRWLVQEEHYFEQKSGVSASFGEMLLLMAIHFHSHQLSSICDLVCQTLGMKIVIRTASMAKMKAIFTQEVFTEQVVASHAIRVPVTKNLSSKISGFLPIHCIHQLLKSRAFSKHRVPIKDWIYKQICASGTPLHPTLPALIEVFVTSILVPASTRGSHEQTNEPIPEAEVRAVFKTSLSLTTVSGTKYVKPGLVESREDEVTNEATQIAMLYYVLLYENIRLAQTKAIMASHRKIVLKYSQDLLSNLPIRYLIKIAEKNQDKFGGVFPQLLKLCFTHYPHLCLTEDWLDEGADEPIDGWQPESIQFNEQELKEAFIALKTCPSQLTMKFKRLLAQRSPLVIWSFADVLVTHMKDILEPATPRQIKELYKEVWFKLNKVYPRQLWVKTVNTSNFSRNDGQQHVNKTISQDDLVLDPLHVLRCDSSFFRCGPLLEIILYMLKACLAASRSRLSKHILENPLIEKPAMSQVSNDVEREELKNALIATQESAAVQMLLEAAQPKAVQEEAKGQRLLSDLKEVQCLICSYLHEAFIAEPNLAKLVHFQGYPLELLSVVVPGVPSMHICLDFAPELLSQPDVKKQIFAVDLISHLSIQYALPKSFSVAKLAVNSLSTLLSVLTVEERNELFPPILPSMVRLCKAFPPLIEDITNLLLQYGKICVSEACLQGYAHPGNFDRASLGYSEDDNSLPRKVQKTLSAIVQTAMLDKNTF